MNIEVGQEFSGILGELIIDPDTRRRRVRSLGDERDPAGILIECSTAVRKNSSLGTIFKINAKVSVKSQGRKYLHSIKKSELLTINEYTSVYG